ncbi:MAG: DNA-protecting protein DprA, partial [Planctomycetota bacterium]|nr:DNA-protecting protein DprA [Planctomycetota bacterium]
MELVSSLHGTLRAALAPGFEMRWWRRLLDRGGTGADLDRPRAAALSRWLGLSRRAAGRLARELASMKPAALLSELDGSGIELDAWHARGYPARMRELADPPPVLFRTGALLPCDENAIGVVGGSTCAAGAAPYAMRMAESVAFDLSRAGITVVLGLITPTVERIAGAVADRGRVLGVVDSDLARYAAARREPDPRAADGHAVFVSERVPRAPPDVPGAVARLVA